METLLKGSVCFKHASLYVSSEIPFIAVPNGHNQRRGEKSAVCGELYNGQSLLQGIHSVALDCTHQNWLKCLCEA